MSADLGPLERRYPYAHDAGCLHGRGVCSCSCGCHPWAVAVLEYVVATQPPGSPSPSGGPGRTPSGLMGPGHLVINFQPGGPGAPAPSAARITQAEAMADVRRQLGRGQRR